MSDSGLLPSENPVDAGGEIPRSNLQYTMSNGQVTVTWGPVGNRWQIQSIATATGGSSFRSFPLWELGTRVGGVKEILFPMLDVAPHSVGGNDEKLFIPFGQGAIRQNPMAAISSLSGQVDAAQLEALGVPSIDGITLLEFPNPGTAAMQFTGLYSWSGKRGFYLQTTDHGGQRKDFSYGSTQGGTLVLTRNYATGPVDPEQGDSPLRPDGWGVKFAQVSSTQWTVTYTQPANLRRESGFDLMTEAVDASSNPVFLEAENPVSVVITVTLDGDEAVFQIEARYPLATYSIPYTWRLTHMEGTLYDFATRYRGWVESSNPPWMQTSLDPDENWMLSRFDNDDARLHVVYGSLPGADETSSRSPSNPSFEGYNRANLAMSEILLGDTAGRRALSHYWNTWNTTEDEGPVEGVYLPDVSPVDEGARAASIQSREDGYYPGLYIHPTVYHTLADYYSRDRVEEDLALIDEDGEVVYIDSTNAIAYLNMSLATATMLERWRHSWIDFLAHGTYQDALSGPVVDAYPDRRATQRIQGGSTLVSSGKREWLVASARSMVRPIDELETEAGAILLGEGSEPLWMDYKEAPGALQAEDNGALLSEKGRVLEVEAELALALCVE